MNAEHLLQHFDRLSEAPDAIPRLRRFILDLAVRGKLLEQDPNDEPAAELLKRNFVWRTESIQRKQIREPRKSLKNIGHDEAPYAIPSSWVWARLGEIIYIQSGDGLTAANMKNGDVPVFGGNGINGYHDDSNVEEPTIVIGRVGYYCGSIHVTPDKAWVPIAHYQRDRRSSAIPYAIGQCFTDRLAGYGYQRANRITIRND